MPCLRLSPINNYTGNEIARYEGFYASVIFVWLSSIGMHLIVEDCTNKGRIDMSVEAEDFIYLIEFKVDMSGEKALAQIKTKGYTEKYQGKGKRIMLIGIGFSSAEKMLQNVSRRSNKIHNSFSIEVYEFSLWMN